MEKEEFGQLIKECDIIIQGGIYYSIFNYISGIDLFDQYLNGVPFSETACIHTIAWYEHAVVFYLYNANERVTAAFPRSEFVEIVEHKDSIIEVVNYSIFNKLKHGKVGSGAIGGSVFKMIGKIGEVLTEKENKVSKKVEGSIYDFVFKDINNSEYIIKVSCEKQNLPRAFSFLLYKHLSKAVDVKNSGACYIATVCYGDDMSLEVIKYREYRDKVLRSNTIGKAIIRIYYRHAELLSIRLKNKKAINRIIKLIILNPIYYIIKWHLSKK